jgi:hypothetical protein
VFWPSYSFCEPFTYGTTGNAAVDGFTWGMDALVPDSSGLSINGVIYRYTTVKDPAAQMLVHVQNENADGKGYIFRETDDWTGLPGNSINKVVSLNNIPISRWGKGSIAVEGEGRVTDPSVVYTYQIDECYTPQANPICPGYVAPTSLLAAQVVVDAYDPMKDDAVTDTLEATDSGLWEEEEEDESIESEKEEATKDTFERGLAASQNALTLANNFSQDRMIRAINVSVNMYTYYATSMNGGVYEETTALKDSQLPENPRGLRNGLAQQLLHEQMVGEQYNN